MKRDLHLTASVDDPEALENIVEQLATRHYDIGCTNATVPPSWQAIDTSSVEIYMSVRVEFDYNKTQRIRIPCVTAFLFSCVKEKNNPYDLMWSISLS